MRAIFNHVLRWEWHDQNPISRVRQSEKRSRIPVVLIFTNWSSLMKFSVVPLASCARLCHQAGGERDQIQFLLGHVSF
jgi:hypothetical protein